MKDPSSRRIPYSVDFDMVDSNRYSVVATVNVGWCRSGDFKIRDGDYYTKVGQVFSMQPDDRRATKDITLVRYQGDGVTEDGKGDTGDKGKNLI